MADAGAAGSAEFRAFIDANRSCNAKLADAVRHALTPNLLAPNPHDRMQSSIFWGLRIIGANRSFNAKLADAVRSTLNVTVLL